MHEASPCMGARRSNSARVFIRSQRRNKSNLKQGDATGELELGPPMGGDHSSDGRCPSTGMSSYLFCNATRDEELRQSDPMGKILTKKWWVNQNEELGFSQMMGGAGARDQPKSR